MSVVMERSASTEEIVPHDQNQQPLEMGADKELAEKSARTGEIAHRDQNQQPLEMRADKELAEKMKKRLFDCAMKREWYEVVRIYEGYPEFHSAKIVRSGDTALHIAVSDGKERIVKQLVELIEQGGELKMVLQIISTEVKKVLENPTHPLLKQSLENFSTKANEASGKFSQLEGNAKEAVRIISDLEAIARTEFSDQLEDGAKKALEIISSKASQAKGIIHRVEAKKAREVIRGEAKEALEKLNKEGKSGNLSKNDLSSDGEAKKSKEPNLEEETKKACKNISGKAKAFSEITLREADSKAVQQISDLANKVVSGAIFRDKWKETLEKISVHLEIIYANEAKKSLGMKNNRGNTALHLAAERGNARMCDCIAKIYREGLGVRNNDLETPFFLAALNGNKDAFLGLHALCTRPEDKMFPLIRGKEGKTVLHCAINGDHFDLALQIVTLYPELADRMTEKGLSPLHVLASKPTAFKSGSHLGWFSKIIYLSEPRHEIFPPNYRTCIESIKLVFKAMAMPMTILGFGTSYIRKVRDIKQKHTRSVQLMNQLLFLSQYYQYEDYGQKPQNATLGLLSSEEEAEHEHPKDDGIGKQTSISTTSKDGIVDEAMQKTVQLLPAEFRGTVPDEKSNIAVIEKKAAEEKPERETPILIAAKNGIMEMVERILELLPVALHDTNSDEKNIVLVVVENRKPDVYRLLMKQKKIKEVIFRKVDKDGNSALHLAAKLGDCRPWDVPGDALQMMREWRWFEFVKESVPMHFFPSQNNAGETPDEIFTKTHKELVKSGGEWLTTTSQSFSVVAALIATVAFATSSTVPGGVKNDTGKPTLENKPAFDVFAISSLVALSFSVTSLMTFLALLTSRRQEKDFGRDLARKLLVGLTSLFISIGAMLISFCAGHLFVLKDKLKHAALPLYAVTCLSATFFAVPQLPLLFDLYRGSF